MIPYSKPRKQARRSRASQRGTTLRVCYKLSPADYDAMLEAQGGVCAICGREPGKRGLFVDHDHSCCPGRVTCGQCVRGLLCPGCNAAMHLFDDHYEKAHDYYVKHQG